MYEVIKKTFWGTGTASESKICLALPFCFGTSDWGLSFYLPAPPSPFPQLPLNARLTESASDSVSSQPENQSIKMAKGHSSANKMEKNNTSQHNRNISGPSGKLEQQLRKDLIDMIYARWDIETTQNTWSVFHNDGSGIFVVVDVVLNCNLNTNITPFGKATCSQRNQELSEGSFYKCAGPASQVAIWRNILTDMFSQIYSKSKRPKLCYRSGKAVTCIVPYRL